ncbi:hypothetical protein [Chryseobacterium sp. c4a]|uniref:hypothetical protein n=1 Tax=Chryseobacterium sp. c4a TaxID=1573582 RepID=UPI00135A1C94|nr:hypothetical protein [Chryseobacterium sp. c4a]
MIFPKAKKIAKDLGWYKTENSVFGLYKGYFFSVSDASLISTPQYKFVTVTTGSLTEEQKLHIKSELQANKRKLRFTNFEIKDNGIFFQFVENITLTQLKTVYSLFDFLVELFKKLNIEEQRSCHNCESEQKNNYYDLNGTGVMFCETCFSDTNNNFYEIERKKTAEEKSYWAGFLGAIIFSIPLIAIWVLFSVYLKGIAMGIALVIAFLGYLGYGYFKGKNGIWRKYIIVITTTISIIISNVIATIASLVKQGSTLSNAIQEFQTSEIVKEVFYANMVISFILGSAAWIWILFIMKDDKLMIKPADQF